MSRPNVIAVIGHSTSQTTREAQQFYSTYGMPLLAPIATYSELTIHSDRHGPNAIRFVPPNKAQAALIAEFIDTERQRSSDPEAFDVLVYGHPDAYGRDLTSQIRLMLDERGVSLIPTDPLVEAGGRVMLNPIMEAVDRNKDTLGALVFAGYSEAARDLLSSLAPISALLRKRLQVILTDGAKASGLLKGLSLTRLPSTHITFVTPERPAKGNASDFRQFFRTCSKDDQDPEIGFGLIAADAAAIVASVVGNEVPAGTSVPRARARVLAALLEPKGLHVGLFKDYSFDDTGELVGGKASLFAVAAGPGGQLTLQSAAVP